MNECKHKNIKVKSYSIKSYKFDCLDCNNTFKLDDDEYIDFDISKYQWRKEEKEVITTLGATEIKAVITYAFKGFFRDLNFKYGTRKISFKNLKQDLFRFEIDKKKEITTLIYNKKLINKVIEEDEKGNYGFWFFVALNTASFVFEYSEGESDENNFNEYLKNVKLSDSGLFDFEETANKNPEKVIYTNEKFRVFYEPEFRDYTDTFMKLNNEVIIPAMEDYDLKNLNYLTVGNNCRNGILGDYNYQKKKINLNMVTFSTLFDQNKIPHIYNTYLHEIAHHFVSLIMKINDKYKNESSHGSLFKNVMNNFNERVKAPYVYKTKQNVNDYMRDNKDIQIEMFK